VKRERLPWLVRVLRALVYGACAALFAWPLAQPTTAVACGLGAVVGGLVGPGLSSTRVRSAWLALSGAAAALLVHGLLGLLAGSSALAELLGSERFMLLVDGLDFGLLALVFATASSALSTRMRWLAFVEVALGGAMVSQLVADHRHGAINRPFEIADPIIAGGGDPVIVFYVLGGAAALLLALVLVLERRVLRLIAHLVVLLLLIGGAGLAVSYGVVPRPDPPDTGLHLTGKPKEPSKKDGKRGRGRPDNDQLEFRDQEQNRDQQTPVAVVLLHDDYSPPNGVYYFRQGAFSQFNGRRLVATTRDGLDRDVAETFPVDELELPEAPQAGIDRAPLETTVALIADHPRPFGLEAPVSFAAAYNSNPDRFRRVYKVSSAALTADMMSLLGHNAGNPKWSADDRAEYLKIPADPRYKDLADNILKPLPPDLAEDPMVKAYAISMWLAKEGIYSLKSKHASATDPTADFLFGDKVGYCVHFAHAATYLLRAVGVPARVATGYAVEESARQGGSAILIASGAAHAWPEVYLEGIGWVVVDVQPERTLDPPPEPADADLQRLLGQLARGMKPLPPDGGPPPTEWVKWLKDFARAAAIAIAYGLAGLLIFLYLVKLWRFVAPFVAPEKSLSRVVYRASLDRLAEVGIARQRGESREAFAARVTGELPSLSPLTSLHVGARFGSARALGAGKAEIVALESRLAAERRRRFAFWRRSLGALLPWSWLRAR
jgi:transglutaminase-like putative cysteine protease